MTVFLPPNRSVSVLASFSYSKRCLYKTSLIQTPHYFTKQISVYCKLNKIKNLNKSLVLNETDTDWKIMFNYFPAISTGYISYFSAQRRKSVHSTLSWKLFLITC